MPARLSQVTRDHARLVLDLSQDGDGASLTVDYRPGRITPRQLHRTQALSARPFAELPSDEQTELMDDTTKLLADCLISWDLFDEHDLPIPPTLDGLQDVDYAAQAIILNAIIEDQRLGKANANGNTGALSPPISASAPADPMTPTSLPAPNGIATAPLPTGSA